MDKVNKIQDLLLFTLSDEKVAAIEGVLQGEFWTLLSGIFSISVLFSFFLDFNFEGVLKRTVQAIAVVAVFSGLFIGAKDIGMTIGNKIVTKENFIFKSFNDALTLTKNGFTKTKEEYKKDNKDEESPWYFLVSSFGSDIVGLLIWIFSHIALLFTKISFTIAYNLILISIPVVAIVNIFPASSKALDGSLISIMWIAVTPIVFAIMVEILDGIVSQHVPLFSFSFIAKGIIGIIFSLFLISTLSISLKIVSSGTIGEAINGISQSMGTGVAMAGVSMVKNHAMKMSKGAGIRTFLRGPNGKSSYVSALRTKGSEVRDKLSDKSTSIQDSKAKTATDLLRRTPNNYSLKERAAVMAGTVARPLDSIRLSKAKTIAAEKSLKEGKGDQVITTQLAKDVSGVKERPRKKLEKGRVVSVDPKTKFPERYYYDDMGKPKEVPSDGTVPKYFGKKPQIFQSGNKKHESRYSSQNERGSVAKPSSPQKSERQTGNKTKRNSKTITKRDSHESRRQRNANRQHHSRIHK